MNAAQEFQFWSVLPIDLKLDCINKMDFVNKIRLRSTSKTERNIVDMKRMELKKLSLIDINYGCLLEMESGDGEKNKIMAEEEMIRKEQVIPMFSYLLKNGNITQLVMEEKTDMDDDAITAITSPHQLHVQKMKIFNLSKQCLLTLKNISPDYLTEVKISGIESAPFDEVLTFDSLKNVEKWSIGQSRFVDIPTKIANYWIEKDMPVGTKMKHADAKHAVLVFFKVSFHRRMLSSNSTQIQIKMNEEKTITLSLVKVRREEGKRDYGVMFVHPTNVQGDDLERYMKNLNIV